LIGSKGDANCLTSPFHCRFNDKNSASLLSIPSVKHIFSFVDEFHIFLHLLKPRRKTMKIQTQLTPRAQQMLALIEKYLASGLSPKAFCAQEQLAYATFQCWLRKYRAQQR
jgi:hypothetical protein